MPEIVVSSKDSTKTYKLTEGKPLFVGRAKECDIVLASPAVSRRHAVVVYKNGICGVKDLGSFNGTLVNGRVISEPVNLREEDALKISSFILRFRLRAGTEAFTADHNPAALVGPAKVKPVKPDSRVFANGIRLPRAMSMPEEMESIPQNDRRGGSDTEVYAPGADTVRFLKSAEAETPPPSTSTTARFRKDAASEPEAPAAPVPDDTAPFAEPTLVDMLHRKKLEEAAEALEAVASLESAASAEAEAIIPMTDPETAPVLTLETDPSDDHTLSALEKLVEDQAETVEPADLPPLRTGEFNLPPATDEFEHVGAAEDDTVSEDREDAPEAGPDPDALDGDAGEAEEEAWLEEDGEFSEYSRAPRGHSARIKRSFKAGTPATGFARAVGEEDSIPVSGELMEAINTRLVIYALLSDLAEDRRMFRMAHPELPEELVRELDRQDAEQESLPMTEEAELSIQELRDRRVERGDDDELRHAVEEYALSQWRLVRDSNRQALPSIYKLSYRLAADEPLAKDLTAAGIAHGRLLGGAMYRLVLQTFAESAERERSRVSQRMRALSQEGTEKGKSSVLSKFGKLGKLANNFRNRAEIREEAAHLEEEDRVGAIRASLATREMAFMEKTLIREFRQLYQKVALHFIPRQDEMPVAVRAFLRHGAVGFKPWWMRDEIRDFILTDCRDNVMNSFERGSDILNVLYADEYLAAVAHMECSPSPDERLAAFDKSSQEWKTDRAYRRIVNARTYNVLMEEMIENLDTRIKSLDMEAGNIEAEMHALKSKSTFGQKDRMFDLQTEHQALGMRRANLAKYVKRIEKEVVSSIIEAVQEAEGRFRKGELTLPNPEALLRHEVAALFDMAARMEGAQRPAFMPLVIRDYYSFGNETLNDRATIRQTIADCEEMDPGLFINTIIAAKKKMNRVEMHLAPTVIVLPFRGMQAMCSLPREGMEGGHLVFPICFGRENLRKRLVSNLLADFRWETSRSHAGRDVMNSDTLAGVFMRIRWEWRNQSKQKREKGMIINEMSDQANWRRVYELYLSDAMTGARMLFQRNWDLYSGLIGRHIDLPEGVKVLRKGAGGDDGAAPAEE